MFGALMIAIGMAISASGGLTALYIGHGVFMGLLGASCMMSPIMTYVTRWFDRRRGTAIALISSGQYIAGVIWPGTFQFTVSEFGWRQSMLFYAVVVAAAGRAAGRGSFSARRPRSPRSAPRTTGRPEGTPVAGLRPNVAFGLFCFAMFCCCMTMSMPMQHIVSLCSDLGIGPAHGAAMLSVLLGTAFVARQFWGWLSDRIGGTRTILFGSIGAGDGDDRISADAGRNRAVRRFGGVWHGLRGS